MFFLLLTLIFLPLLCLVATWYVQDAVPEFMRVGTSRVCNACLPLVMKVVLGSLRILNDMRSNYIWDTRVMYPPFARNIVDKCYGIDPDTASLCVSDGHKSVRVEEAVVTYEGSDYDVRDMMSVIWASGNGDSVFFYLHRALGCEDVLLNTESNLTLRVRYTGHRNFDKRIPPQTYSVRYTGEYSGIARFPPYPASSPVKRGLGSVKILSAVREDGVSCLEEARESAGLRGKFYEDVNETGSPDSKVINFLDESDRIHEDIQIKVLTSKGIVECN